MSVYIKLFKLRPTCKNQVGPNMKNLKEGPAI